MKIEESDDDNTAIVKYELEAKKADSDNWAVVPPQDGENDKSLTRKVPDLEASTMYDFKVTSYDANGVAGSTPATLTYNVRFAPGQPYLNDDPETITETQYSLEWREPASGGSTIIKHKVYHTNQDDTETVVEVNSDQAVNGDLTKVFTDLENGAHKFQVSAVGDIDTFQFEGPKSV